jgi:hypothetical protein
MSWSITKQSAAVDAHQEFDAATHNAEYDNATRAVLDDVAAFAAGCARRAPAGSDVTLDTSGHVDANGTGSFSVKIMIGTAVKGAKAK